MKEKTTPVVSQSDTLFLECFFEDAVDIKKSVVMVTRNEYETSKEACFKRLRDLMGLKKDEGIIRVKE